MSETEFGFDFYFHLGLTFLPFRISHLKTKFETLFKINPAEQILAWSNDDLNHIGSSPSNINNVVFNDCGSSVHSSRLSLHSHPSQSHSLPSHLKRTSLITTGITLLADDFPISELSTSENVPLFLINGQMNSKIRSLPGPIGAIKFPELSAVANTDVDAQYGKLCSSLAYTVLRQIDRFVHNYKLACSVPSHML